VQPIRIVRVNSHEKDLADKYGTKKGTCRENLRVSDGKKVTSNVTYLVLSYESKNSSLSKQRELRRQTGELSATYVPT